MVEATKKTMNFFMKKWASRLAILLAKKRVSSSEECSSGELSELVASGFAPKVLYSF